MIADLIKAFTHITFGLAFGLVLGVSIVTFGLNDTISKLPRMVQLAGMIVLSVGILIIIAYFRPDKLEKIK